jgi:hypothetical protein
MSTEEDKIKHSKRLHQEEVAIKKQVKIAKAAGVTNIEPHKFAKHHAMDCGNPECPLCGNPRKTHKDTLTTQEKRLFQDVEQTRDRHSNGLSPKEE